MSELSEVRCKACDRLLMKAVIFIGAIKCNGCKQIFEYKFYTASYFALYDPDDKKVYKAKAE